ncbi:MAG: helix-turn-helix transcriptional regulator [Clostridia bacterium]|nr:helix-turn-helix transcriptional regulator [Clostridia bacterium]
MKTFFESRNGDYKTDAHICDWLYVNNCGYWHNIKDNMTVFRDGRKDYHLLYVKSGKAFIGKREVIYDNQFYIYTPGQRHEYAYAGVGLESCHYFWVHFTGYAVEKILNEIGLCAGAHTSPANRADEIEKLWSMLTEAKFFSNGNLPNYPATLLWSLLTLLATPKIERSPFSGAAKQLENVTTPVSVSELAARYRMSVGHFIRSFKEAYGYTPMNYRIIKQVEQAKSVLAEMDITVAKVSELCGFTDPLYFSRQFKKHTGLSPTQYRDKFRESLDINHKTQ